MYPRPPPRTVVPPQRSRTAGAWLAYRRADCSVGGARTSDGTIAASVARNNGATKTLAEDFVPVAEEWDAAMQTCLQRICQTEQLNRRWFLKGDGGLGITELAAEAPSLRYRRYIQTKLTILQCLPGELSESLVTMGKGTWC